MIEASSAQPYFAVDVEQLFARLTSGADGLTQAIAAERLARRPTIRRDGPAPRAFRLLLAQFRSPLTLLLLAASGLAFLVHDRIDALIIVGIVVITALLGFWQEWGAGNAVAALLARVRTTSRVLRDGAAVDIPLEMVVPGDIVLLKAGDAVPGDGRVLQTREFFVSEAALTGEAFPVNKHPATLPATTPLAGRSNCVFFGTHVISGTATALIAASGKDTAFGGIAERLRLHAPESEFERGVRQFGYLLLEITLVLAVVVFAINVALHRPILDAFLFTLALAVGLTPQLLPAIISVNLARGARRMAAEKVIVKRLAAIENFGSMNVLCCDKTGTLTTGVARIQGAYDLRGEESREVFRYAYLNATMASGFANPIDDAIRDSADLDASDWEKGDELPYDFLRRRVSVAVRHGSESLLICKGAVDSVLPICTHALGATGPEPMDGHVLAIRKATTAWAEEGFRVLAVAVRQLRESQRLEREHETALTFVGTIVIEDPPKAGAGQAIAELRQMGVSLRIITGDHHSVATHIARAVGIPATDVLTGPDIQVLTDDALRARASRTQVFAEVDPSQKERIVLALKKGGAVVGFLGDGINDAAAIHAADVGLSVDTAVDVAREAAALVLLEPDLGVLARGIREGRRTFANTLKYVFMASSANLGNMVSLAGASLVLPFLPLLPKQVLLANLLADVPEMTIASDRVDQEFLDRPRRWDVRSIRRFMLTFGALSSLFDWITFAVLLMLLHATPIQFRTAWFLESMVSATLVILVVRTRRQFWASRPAWPLTAATLATATGATLLPFSPLGPLFGFSPLPWRFLWPLVLIVGGYIGCTEIAKRLYYTRMHPE